MKYRTVRETPAAKKSRSGPRYALVDYLVRSNGVSGFIPGTGRLFLFTALLASLVQGIIMLTAAQPTIGVTLSVDMYGAQYVTFASSIVPAIAFFAVAAMVFGAFDWFPAPPDPSDMTAQQAREHGVFARIREKYIMIFAFLAHLATALAVISASGGVYFLNWVGAVALAAVHFYGCMHQNDDIGFMCATIFCGWCFASSVWTWVLGTLPNITAPFLSLVLGFWWGAGTVFVTYTPSPAGDVDKGARLRSVVLEMVLMYTFMTPGILWPVIVGYDITAGAQAFLPVGVVIFVLVSVIAPVTFLFVHRFIVLADLKYLKPAK